jgi:hypothetical protein
VFEKGLDQRARELHAHHRRLAMQEWRKLSAEEKASLRSMYLKSLRNRARGKAAE